MIVGQAVRFLSRLFAALQRVELVLQLVLFVVAEFHDDENADNDQQNCRTADSGADKGMRTRRQYLNFVLDNRGQVVSISNLISSLDLMSNSKNGSF